MPLLYSQSFGQPSQPPLIILPGLMGSSRNWLAAARELAHFAHVHVVDLRNHGESFHSPEMNYAVMAEDLLEWLQHQQLSKANIMGHSMGGKLAIYLAVQYPEVVDALIVVENAPRKHRSYFEKEITALVQLDISQPATRAELEERLKVDVPDWALRKFLMSNLTRDDEGKWRWMPNVTTLLESLPILADNPIAGREPSQKEALFVIGGDSHFVSAQDRDEIQHYFPRATLTTIDQANHNPHFSQREAFTRVIQNYLENEAD